MASNVEGGNAKQMIGIFTDSPVCVRKRQCERVRGRHHPVGSRTLPCLQAAATHTLDVFPICFTPSSRSQMCVRSQSDRTRCLFVTVCVSLCVSTKTTKN